jgi:2-polyprenyl-3-methyl-5-hydroxy-6-metoxy-1,4-benzoquinol methylase
MGRYHQTDDLVFQKLRATGEDSWNQQANPQATFTQFLIRPFLEKSVASIAKPLTALSAMDIGCGTGPISMSLCPGEHLDRGR